MPARDEFDCPTNQTDIVRASHYSDDVHANMRVRIINRNLT